MNSMSVPLSVAVAVAVGLATVGRCQSPTALAKGTAVPTTATDPRTIVLGETQTIVTTKKNEHLYATWSFDQRKLLYWAGSSGDESRFVILDAQSFVVEKQVSYTGDAPMGLALSPDYRRIVFFRRNQLVLLEVESGENVDLPGSVSPSRFLEWPTEKELWLGYDSQAEAFDLDLLKITTKAWKGDARVWESLKPEAWSINSHAFLDFRTSLTGNELSILARDRSFRRRLIMGESAGEYRVRRDLAYLMRIAYDHATQRHSLQVTRLTVDLNRILRFTFNLDLDGLLSQRSPERFKELQATGAQIWADVYGPRTNPLNQKVIGAELKQYRGEVSVRRLGDQRWSAEVTYEVAPLAVGDIITKFRGRTAKDQWVILDEDEWATLGPEQADAGQPVDSTSMRIAPADSVRELPSSTHVGRQEAAQQRLGEVVVTPSKLYLGNVSRAAMDAGPVRTISIRYRGERTDFAIIRVATNGLLNAEVVEKEPNRAYTVHVRVSPSAPEGTSEAMVIIHTNASEYRTIEVPAVWTLKP